MTKRKVNYGAQLSLQVAPDLQMKLVAAGYLRGDRGAYAGICREVLTVGFTEWYNKLSESRRKEFDEILATLKASEGLSEVTE